MAQLPVALKQQQWAQSTDYQNPSYSHLKPKDPLIQP
jgi:hypothetical protein